MIRLAALLAVPIVLSACAGVLAPSPSGLAVSTTLPSGALTLGPSLPVRPTASPPIATLDQAHNGPIGPCRVK